MDITEKLNRVEYTTHPTFCIKYNQILILSLPGARILDVVGVGKQGIWEEFCTANILSPATDQGICLKMCCLFQCNN